jgi:pimeloyl-ACP methyl ester carboxylesterase
LDHVLDGAGPIVLFGNSMGGHAAIMYARTRPERVAGLVLCSPGGAPMPPDELATFSRTFDLATFAQAAAFVDRLFMRRNVLRPLVALGVKQKFGHPNMRQLIASLSPGDMLRSDDVRELDMPTLIMWGREDRIMPPSHVEFFRRHLPPAGRLEEPDHFSHSPYLDKPGEVARRILAFAAEIDGARRLAEIARDRALSEEHGARVAGESG